MKKLGMISCVVAMLGASPAFAAPPRAAGGSGGSGGSGLDGNVTVLGILGYSYYFANAYGLGIRYQKTLAPNLLRAQIRDDLALEGGLDLTYSSWTSYWDYPYTVTGTYTAVSPVVGLVWNFWLNDKIAIYPKMDLGWEFGSVKWDSTNPYWNSTLYWSSHAYGGAYLDLAGGLAIKLERVSLRLQAGIHGLYAGVGFQL